MFLDDGKGRLEDFARKKRRLRELLAKRRERRKFDSFKMINS